MPDLIILFLNNQLWYKVQNLPCPCAPPEKKGAGAWPKTSSQTPSQGLKFQWRKGSGTQLGKGPHPRKAGEGTGAFRDPQNTWRCQESPQVLSTCLKMLGAPRDTGYTWRRELIPKPPPNKPEDAESP